MLLLQRTSKGENPDALVEKSFYETLDTFDGNHLKEALKQFHQWYDKEDSVKKKSTCGSQSFASVRHYSSSLSFLRAAASQHLPCPNLFQYDIGRKEIPRSEVEQDLYAAFCGNIGIRSGEL